MGSSADLDVATLRDWLARALPIARDAASLLREAWRGAMRAYAKSRGDLVTELDLCSEAMIRARLAEAFPDHAVIGEEGGGEEAELAWYVDPLDGTTNFLHGHPFFCVSMALVRAAEEPLVGIVVAPALAVEWTAIRGGGATRNGAPCAVSATQSLDDALLSTGFPAWRAHHADNNYRAFLALDAASRGVRRCGASAIEIAMVADGSYDAFWDLGLKPWDVAAASLMVLEAGGAATDFGGGPLRLGGGRILVSNGRIHRALVEGLAGAIPLPPLGLDRPSGLPGSGEVG
jgi:myo-inositol-1(or 4)-monophosphatase